MKILFASDLQGERATLLAAITLQILSEDLRMTDGQILKMLTRKKLKEALSYLHQIKQRTSAKTPSKPEE